jgi:hypothetical protein
VRLNPHEISCWGSFTKISRYSRILINVDLTLRTSSVFRVEMSRLGRYFRIGLYTGCCPENLHIQETLIHTPHSYPWDGGCVYRRNIGNTVQRSKCMLDINNDLPAEDVKLTLHLHLVRRLRTSGAVPPLARCLIKQRDNFTFLFKRCGNETSRSSYFTWATLSCVGGLLCWKTRGMSRWRGGRGAEEGLVALCAARNRRASHPTCSLAPRTSTNIRSVVTPLW